MKNKIIPYIFFLSFAGYILSSCSADYSNEPDSGTPRESDILSLTVSASDIVESNEPSTRSSEENGITTFGDGECVGLIILDRDGNTLADNVPYIFDDKTSNWSFWADNPDEKQPVYYDKAMYSYLVYYPYDNDINGCKTEDEIKSKGDVFAPQKDQSSEDKYRKADILIWTHEGDAIRHINAELEHVYDSFTFHINIKWNLEPIGKELVYQPMKETLKNFKIEYTTGEGEKIILFDNDDQDNNITYRVDDGSYRYLLSYGQGGKITWQYTYREITFHGERIIPTDAEGKRYIHHEKADMGDLPGRNMQISDFYCNKDTLGKNIGYVFPWDAAYPLNGTDEKKEKPFAGHHCIGVVVGVGQHDNDASDYSQSRIGKEECRGYVMALTELDQLSWLNSNFSSTLTNRYIGTYAYNTTRTYKASIDWSGFIIKVK